MKQIDKKVAGAFAAVFVSSFLQFPCAYAENSVHSNTDVSGVRTVEDDVDLNSSPEHPEQDLKKPEESSQAIELKVIPELQTNQKSSDSQLSDHEEMQLDEIEHKKETGKITETEADLEESSIVSTEAVIKF